jgi:ABC-2 type transport system permease protein
MAVYKRAYRPYEGPLTPERWRFLVIPRFAFQELFQSRLVVGYLVLTLIPFLIEVGWVYLANNEAARALLGIQFRPDDDPFVIDARFFVAVMGFQSMFAFVLTAWVGPVIVSPDLVNGALPLYLSRPLSRGDYVLGKATALFGLLSLVTWIPGLLLFALQAGLAGGEWLSGNYRVAFAILLGSWLWIGVLTLLALALSAWIKWRLVATGALFAIFFFGSAFGELWRGLLRNAWGRLANLSYLIVLVWRELFGIESRRSLARDMLDDRRVQDLPVWAASVGLLAVCAICLWLLDRRLQAREVVR